MEIWHIYITFFVFRLLSLFKSIKNEKKLKQGGAIEYGKKNSIVLTWAHVAFYLFCIGESLFFGKTFNHISAIGSMVFIFSMISLWWVIFQLGPLWTVKLYIAKEHTLNTNKLFAWIKHPNYYMNVIPEIIGIALLCQAYYTLLFGLPLYLIPLIIRIRQEEKVMYEKFSDY